MGGRTPPSPTQYVPFPQYSASPRTILEPNYGENFLVSGLGLIGLITGQLLIANGCEDFGVDPDENKCSLAKTFGIKALNISENENQVSWCLNNTSDVGIDGAIIKSFMAKIKI